MSDQGQLNNTIKLLGIIGSPLREGVDNVAINDCESQEMYNLAARNKISLLYLDTLKKQGKLDRLCTRYDEEMAKYQAFVAAVSRVAGVLGDAGIEYVVMKTIRPYPAIPSDIDVVVLGSGQQYEDAVVALLRAGYIPRWGPSKLEAIADNEAELRSIAAQIIKPTFNTDGHVSPGGTGVIDPVGNIDIDLQQEVALSYLVYLDKTGFRDYIDTVTLPNKETVCAPRPGLDLAIMMAHSLTEQKYVLGEYYTTLHHFALMDQQAIETFVNVARYNSITHAVKTHLSLTALLYREAHGETDKKLETVLNNLGVDAGEMHKFRERSLKTPYKYRWQTIGRFFQEKMKEPRFRKSAGRQVIKMLDPRLSRLVLSEVVQMRRQETK